MKQRAKQWLCFLACVLVVAGCKSAPPDLVGLSKKIESITVYDLEGLSGSTYTAQQLDNAFQATIEPEQFRPLASEARYKNEWVLWKGSRLAIVRTDDGKNKLLALSYYGGFFKVLGEDGFFFFEGAAREKWNELFAIGIVQKQFIPKRIARNLRLEAESPNK